MRDYIVLAKNKVFSQKRYTLILMLLAVLLALALFIGIGELVAKPRDIRLKPLRPGTQSFLFRRSDDPGPDCSRCNQARARI